jgi:hypothetical protein
MLTALRTGVSFRLAILLTAFASLCFVAPPAVLAFGHGNATADCMAHADMVGHGKTTAASGLKHHQGKHSSPAGDHQPSCCGLFCMSAIVIDGGAIEPTAVVSTTFAILAVNLFSRGPERLDRPPISSSSV